MLRHSLRLTSKPFSKFVSLKNVVNKNIISMTSRYISSFKTEYDGHEPISIDNCLDGVLDLTN